MLDQHAPDGVAHVARCQDGDGRRRHVGIPMNIARHYARGRAGLSPAIPRRRAAGRGARLHRLTTIVTEKLTLRR
jgi:hypothetical protein